MERESSRPAFQALMYSGRCPRTTRSFPRTRRRPSCCVAADDKDPTRERARAVPEAARGRRRAPSCTSTRKGGHGFGMKDRPLPHHRLAGRFREWMAARVPEPRSRPAHPQGFLTPGHRRRRAAGGDPAHGAPRLAAGSAVRRRRCGRSSRSTASSCHGGDKPKAELDLRPYTSLDTVVRDHARWAQVLEQAGRRRDAARRRPSSPPAEARQQVVDWIAARAQRARPASTPAIPARCWRGG